MPAWIHDRAMELKRKMKDTYGPEKAEQVAFAVATQQSHKLGKSPKSYGTAQGRREAKAKFDKPIKEYTKTAGIGLPTPKAPSITGGLNTQPSGVGTPQKGLIGAPMASKSIPMKSMGGAGSTLAGAKGVSMPTVKVPASAPVPAGLKKGSSLAMVRFSSFVDEMLKIAGNGATRLAMDLVEEATDQVMRRPSLRSKITGKAPKEEKDKNKKPKSPGKGRPWR